MKDKESGLPKKYVSGLSKSTAKARAAHWKKMAKYSDRDPRAYEPAPGDKTAKTKLSKYTKKYREMFGEEMQTINEKAAAGLAAKAKKSGISLSTLKTVYRRGVAAWNSGHRPGTTPQQWGHARVNSYITKGKTYHTADKDLREEGVAEGSEEKDPIWNKGTPMPKDYTCHCGLYVHPSRRNPKAIHASDCPYAKKQDKEQGVAEGKKKQKDDLDDTYNQQGTDDKGRNRKDREDDDDGTYHQRGTHDKGNKKQGVAEADKHYSNTKNPVDFPKTWHDVDKKLGKAVDKMSQAEKVKKGLAASTKLPGYHPKSVSGLNEAAVLRKKYLGKLKGKTETGKRANQINIEPEMKIGKV